MKEIIITLKDTFGEYPCQICGHKSPMEFSVETEIWRTVMPPNESHYSPCIQCFLQRMKKYLVLQNPKNRGMKIEECRVVIEFSTRVYYGFD